MCKRRGSAQSSSSSSTSFATADMVAGRRRVSSPTSTNFVDSIRCALPKTRREAATAHPADCLPYELLLPLSERLPWKPRAQIDCAEVAAGVRNAAPRAA